MLQKIIWLSLAGAAGTLARYALTGFVQKINATLFPWGTVAVNITGCFFAGFLWILFENRWPVSGDTRTVIMLGFMGAFTTFSSLILETSMLLRSEEWLYAVANLTMQNSFGFFALFAGLMIGRMV